MVSLQFFIDIILLVAGVDSASNRNEYQESFLEVKPDNLTMSNLNLLGPSGPVQACSGIALRLQYFFSISSVTIPLLASRSSKRSATKTAYALNSETVIVK
jgi:hypothetical protein